MDSASRARCTTRRRATAAPATTSRSPPRPRPDMSDGFRGYDDLIVELRRLCAERRTGTLFIATADNEGGQLGLHDGIVVMARFRRKTGMEAAYGIRKIARA